MSKLIKNKLAITRIVFFILLSILFFLFGFTTSNNRSTKKRNRNGIIFELRISPKEGKTTSKIFATLITQEEKEKSIMNEEKKDLDLRNPANIIGTIVKYIDFNGEEVENVVISYAKDTEDNYIRLYLVNG